MRIVRLAAVVLAFWSAAAMSTVPATRSRSFHLDASGARAFPLFTPLGERAWAHGWEPQMLSGETDVGSVFRTRGHGGRETTWIVAAYEPARLHVAYARLVDGLNMGLVDVTCRDAHGGVDVTVRYTLTGLSAEGDAHVREFLDADQYASFIEEWRVAIATALR